MSEQQTPLRGVEFQLGGRTLYLRYSLATRKRLITQLGGEEKLKQLSGEQISAVILEGVKASFPDVTKEWIEEEVDMQNLGYVVEKMSEAMGQKKKADVLVTGEVPPAP